MMNRLFKQQNQTKLRRTLLTVQLVCSRRTTPLEWFVTLDRGYLANSQSSPTVDTVWHTVRFNQHLWWPGLELIHYYSAEPSFCTRGIY